MDALAWQQFWEGVDDERWLAAKALLELSSPLRLDATQWLREGDPDWQGWLDDVDTQGRGWSSTEHRLFQVVASLVAEEPRTVQVRGILDGLGSWEAEVWRILVEWGTGGNNREVPGRATVVIR